MTRYSASKPPLDAAAIERLALRYVERYATTRARLSQYLKRKMAERGVAGEVPDPAVIADRFAELGYIDDRGFGEAKAQAMARRGLGGRRVSAALRHAGLDDEDREALSPDIAARSAESALAFARRRRIGPFADRPADRDMQRRQLAAMLRAGHDYDLARRIVETPPGADPTGIETTP